MKPLEVAEPPAWNAWPTEVYCSRAVDGSLTPRYVGGRVPDFRSLDNCKADDVCLRLFWRCPPFPTLPSVTSCSAYGGLVGTDRLFRRVFSEPSLHDTAAQWKHFFPGTTPALLEIRWEFV